MSFAAATQPRSRRPHLDPVLILPAAVAAGLGVGWIGVDAGVGGGRVAVDLILAWVLVAASLATLGRARWGRPRTLLAAAAFAVLAADLQWATSDALWTIGWIVEDLWLALLVQLVVTFPLGRAWSNAGRLAIAGAYAAALGGQVARALVGSDARDVIAVTSDRAWSNAIERAQSVLGAAVAIVVVAVVLQRLRVLGRPARLVQGPFFAGAAVTALTVLVTVAVPSDSWPGAASRHTVVALAALLVPLGLIAGVLRSRLRRPEASDLVVELRTGGATTLQERLARALGDENLELAYRIDGSRYVDAAGRPMDVASRPDRAVTLIRAGGEDVAALVHDAALLDDPALVESVRATAALSSRTSGSPPRCSRSWPRCGRPAPGSWRSQTASDDGSNGTSTTASSSGW